MKALFAVALSVALLGSSILDAKASQPSQPEKEWTMMVFLNGDNNLDSFGTADMKEMEMVGSSEQVNIIVLRDTSRSNISSKIYYVEKGKSRVVKDYGSNIDMGDWRNLVEFFRYAQENFPAKKYFVDIWNHGSGWRKNVEEVDPTRGISYDDHSGNFITTPQLGEAFRQMQSLIGGRKLDLLGMDACLMQMTEVSYEVRNSIGHVVASEENEPGDGWAYQLFLGELAKKPTMNGAELSVIVEREYARSYDGGVQGTKTVQGSAVSTEKLDLVVEKINAFATQGMALAPLYHRQFMDAAEASQHFGETTFKDFQDYLLRVKRSVPDAGLRQSIDEALASLGEAVLANFTTGTNLNNAHGISVWFPDSLALDRKSSEYGQLSWARDSLWDEFLSALLAPQFPLLSVGSVSFRDENTDGFLKAGEKITFQVELANDSTFPASNVQLSVTGPAELAAIGAPVVIASVEKGKITVDGPTATFAQGVPSGTYLFKLRVELPGEGAFEKEVPVQVDRDYVIEDLAISTSHPYNPQLKQEWEISRPGAESMRLHFSRFETERKYDTVQILDKAGTVLMTLEGLIRPFWTVTIPGDYALIRFKTDDTVTMYGFDIDKIAY